MAEYNIQGNTNKKPSPETAHQMSRMEYNTKSNVPKQPLPETTYQMGKMEYNTQGDITKQPETTNQMSRMEYNIHGNARQQLLPETVKQISRMPASGMPTPSVPIYRQQERIHQPEPSRQSMQPTCMFQSSMPQPMQTTPPFQAGTIPRTSIMTSGVGVRNSVLTGTDFSQGFLQTQIGRHVKVEFLIGTNMLVDREGDLVKVGTDYIIIQETATDDYLLCDMYSIKFIRFYY